MLSKLALKNAGKSIREYAIYFFTLAFGVCVFYLFNSIYAQQAMLDLTETQADAIKSVSTLLGYISVFVAVVLGFLVVYANNFFIKRRKQELGIYMTLGMGKRRISTILVLETSLVAVFALAVGLAAGVFLSQFMSLVTAKMFEADLTGFQFVFSPDAAGKSVLYFGIIFVIVIAFNTFAVSRFKLIDLIYGGRKNENRKMRSVRICAVLWVLSMAILGTAYYLILDNGMIDMNSQFYLSIGLGCVGTLLFFYSLSGLLTLLLQARKGVYYHGLNMFVVRQLSSKINTNFISISVVSIVLLLTIGIFSVGYSLQDLMSQTLVDMVSYDCTFLDELDDPSEQEQSFSAVYPFLADNENVSGYSVLHLYDAGMTYDELHAQIPEGTNDAIRYNSVPCVSLSDYNKTVALRGIEGITLAENEYAILTTAGYDTWEDCAQEMVDSRRVFTVGGTPLIPKLVTTEAVDNSYWPMLMIVPDGYISGLTCDTTEMNVMCVDDTAREQFQTQLEDIKFEDMSDAQRGFEYYYSRIDLYAASVSSRALFSFIAIYLGIVFMMTCAAILAIQQLTEASDNKHRYDLLGKLGADPRMLRRALLTQIACYFLLPLLLAVVHSFFGLWAANEALMSAGGMGNMAGSIAATAVFVGALYLAYFGMTYVGAKSCLKL